MSRATTSTASSCRHRRSTIPAGPSVLPGGLPPGDAGFAGQHGWLRQQVSTTLPASGSAACRLRGHLRGRRLDATVDYTTASSTLPAGTAWRWTTTLHRPRPPVRTWQLKVFVKDQISAQLFVDGLATAQRRDQHRRIRRCSRRHRRLFDRRLGRPCAGGEVARGARAPTSRLHADLRGRRDARASTFGPTGTRPTRCRFASNGFRRTGRRSRSPQAVAAASAARRRS